MEKGGMHGIHLDRNAELVREQYRTLKHQIPTMYLVLLINSFFLAYVTSDVVDPFLAYQFPGLLLVLVVIRIVVWMRRSLIRAELSTAQMQRTMQVTTLMSGIIGIALCSWAIALLEMGRPLQQSYVPLYTALSTITCAACLISLPRAAYVIIVVGTLPISVALMLTGDRSMVCMGFNLVVIALFVMSLVARQFAQIRRIVSSNCDIQTEKQKVSELAFRDQLTALPNRRAFLDELGRCNALLPHYAVAMIDLDGFKAINDTYGHAAGDTLLVEASRRLEERLTPGDMVARLGGDEFAVLLRDVDILPEAQERVGRLANAFDAPVVSGAQAFRVKASFGLAHGGSSERGGEDMLNRADLALYEAKHRGKADISLFEPAMEEKVRRRIMIEQGLSDPAGLDTLTLAFQPVVAARTQRITGFEALARWHHPLLGNVPPAEFIAVAEQCGIIDRLTTQLMRQALDAAMQWPDAVGLSINLSTLEIASPDLDMMLLDLLREYDFPPERLSIEVTETALLRDFATARRAIQMLQAYGVRVLLDDFGAGYASIGYLREIRFDGIKLDGGLIRPITESAGARDLLVGVLGLCRAVGSTVTAEMVESKAHYILLRQMGVDFLQGYHLGRPMPLADTLAVLDQPIVSVA